MNQPQPNLINLLSLLNQKPLNPQLMKVLLRHQLLNLELILLRLLKFINSFLLNLKQNSK